jgi:transposase-like protein
MTEKHAGGRPTKYNPKFHPQLVFWLSQAGLTDKKIAKELSITEQTLNNWKKKYPKFFESLKDGKETPDDQVEAALFRRAKGFTYQEGERSRVALPDTTACIFWLKNRRPDKWRDKQEREYSGKDGGPIQVAAAMGALTDEQLDQYLAAVDKAAHEGSITGEET